MAPQPKKQSEPDHHPDRDHAYFDQADTQQKKWREDYLDADNFGPEEQEREARRDDALVKKPHDHEPPQS